MNKSFGIALLLAGIALTVLGALVSESIASDVSTFLTGLPKGRAVWMLIGGIFMSLLGLRLTAGNS